MSVGAIAHDRSDGHMGAEALDSGVFALVELQGVGGDRQTHHSHALKAGFEIAFKPIKVEPQLTSWSSLPGSYPTKEIASLPSPSMQKVSNELNSARTKGGAIVTEADTVSDFSRRGLGGGSRHFGVRHFCFGCGVGFRGGGGAGGQRQEGDRAQGAEESSIHNVGSSIVVDS
jgi:hypothetical protein